MDNLQYIRDAIKLHGKRTQVEVIRWEINPATGAQDTPYKVKVNAEIALRELQKPINKRSFTWARIRPVGDTMLGLLAQKGDMNSLSDPDLLSKMKEELKAQLRAEVMAELAAESGIVEEPKPKRKKKEASITEEEPSLVAPDSSGLLEASGLNELDNLSL